MRKRLLLSGCGICTYLFLFQPSLWDICRVELFRPTTSSDRVKVSHPPPLLGNWVHWRNNDVLRSLVVFFSFASDSGGSLEWRIPTSASRILVVCQSKVVALVEDTGAAGNCKSATRISTVFFWYVERRFFMADLTNERFSRFQILFGVAFLMNRV